MWGRGSNLVFRPHLPGRPPPIPQGRSEEPGVEGEVGRVAGRYPELPFPPWPLGTQHFWELGLGTGPSWRRKTGRLGLQQDRAWVCEPAAWAERSLHFPIPTGSPHRP